jgi:tetratricopeptide (TPR) repeat protein
MSLASYRIDKISLLMIFIVLAVALFARAAYFKDYKNTPAYPVLSYSDGYSYVIWAKDISNGDIIGNKAFMKWPFYAYFLAFLFKLSGASLPFVYLIQLMLGALNCVLVYFIAKTMFRQGVAFLAALLCAWYGVFVFYDFLPIYNCLSLFLNSLLFLFFLRIQDKPDKKNLFWLGILSGISTITKAGILIFAIFAPILILWQKRVSLKKLANNYSFFCLGLLIIISSVILRNYWVEKDFVFIAANTGINFYLGNNPKADGLFQSPENIALNQEGMFRDAKVVADKATGRDLKASQVSRYWFNKGVAFAVSDPARYLKLSLRKLGLIFSPEEFFHEIEYYSISDKIRVFKVMFMDLRFILPFAFLGMFVNLRQAKVTALLYLAIIAFSLGIAMFFVTARYRVSMAPFLIIFATSGIFSLWEALRRRNYLRLNLLCLVLASLFILLDYHLFYNKPDHKNGLKEISPASRFDPNDHYCLLTYGAMYYNMGDLKMAEKMFRQAIKVFPLSVDAYYNLGLLYNKEKMFSQARDVLIQAVSLDSQDFAAHFELGKVYKATGEFKEAIKEFNFALNIINRSRFTERAAIEKELADLNK